MLKTKEVQIEIISRNIKKYISLGYECKVGDFITIKIEDLNKSSDIEIECECDTCHSDIKLVFKSYVRNVARNSEYSCPKCKGINIRKTVIKRYGVANVAELKTTQDKKIKTNIERYGVDNPMKNAEVLEKNKNTVREKYGVDNVFQLSEIQDKAKNNMVERHGVEYAKQSSAVRETERLNTQAKYGVDHVQSTNEVKNKIKQSTINKFGVDNVFRLAEFRGKDKKKYNIIQNFKSKYNHLNILNVNFDTKELTLMCDKGCEHTFNISFINFYNRNRPVRKNTICTFCNPIDISTSGIEGDVRRFIESIYSGNIIYNTKKIISNELDIYLPNENIAFEINGLYWHSDEYKDKDYHKLKSDECRDNGIILMHIWEDDWRNKQDVVKSIIKSSLNIFDVNIYPCMFSDIKEVSGDIVEVFMLHNSVELYIKADTNVGLYVNDELIAVSSFIEKSNQVIITNICSKLNIDICNGIILLYEYFKNKMVVDKKFIVNYDRSYFIRNLYGDLFTYKYDSEPTASFIIDGDRVYCDDTNVNFGKIYNAGYAVYEH